MKYLHKENHKLKLRVFEEVYINKKRNSTVSRAEGREIGIFSARILLKNNEQLYNYTYKIL